MRCSNLNFMRSSSHVPDALLPVETSVRYPAEVPLKKLTLMRGTAVKHSA
jgi:hypothetical protein